MKKHLIFIITLFTAALLSISASAVSFTQAELDDYNNIYYPQSIYNGGIKAAPQTSTQEAGVDPATGSVNVKVTDVSLPGVNGFDLNVTRMYNSSNAALFEAYMEETDNPVDVTYYAIVGKKQITKEKKDGSTEYEQYNNIGLTPDFFTYLDSEDDEWLVNNSAEYEYEYSSNASTAYLFDNLTDAQAAASELNSAANEINAYYIFSDVLYYRVNYYNFTAVAVTKTESYTTYSNGLLDYTSNDKYSRLGTGWEFTFPYIEIRYGYDRAYRYLHFGEKGTWLMDFDKGGNNLDGYPLNDIKIVKDSSVTHDGISSWYRVDEKNGTKHYFAEDGRLLIQQDRYGNQIKFYCDTQNFTSLWGFREPHPYITKIVDTMGREVVFTYENDASDSTIKYVYINITDPADAGNKKTYRYVLFRLDSDEIGILDYAASSELSGDEWILRSVKDPTGYTCTYTYNYLTTKFSFLDRNEDFYTDYYDSPDSTKGNSYFDSGDMTWFDGVYNRYALLETAIGYNSTTCNFKYAPFVKNCTVNGSMIFYKAYESQEDYAKNYDWDSYNTNKKTYTYDINRVGEYDGYITYGFNDEILPSYTYAVKVTDGNVADGKTSYDIYSYSYGGAYRDTTILLNRHDDYGTDHKIVTSYTYNDDTKLVTNVSSVNYSVSDSTKYMTTSTAYTYDAENYGDILIQTPNGNGDRAVTYTYDSTYHFPLSKTYKRDSATSVKEEYVPTSDGKSIEFINIYENGVLKTKTRYAHDSYGNIVNEKQYINTTDYVEKQYTYQDGVFVTAETVKNVTDNDNVTNDITTYATYDYWGNPLTVTDANGNTTVYEYDLSNQVIQVTNPDGSQKTYEHETYYEDQCVWETDELGNIIKTNYLYARKPERIRYNSVQADYKEFYYDPFGNLATEVLYSDDFDENGWQTEQNRTEYTYDTLQRPTSKKVYDNSGTLLYNEQYSYDVTSAYTKETVTVVGNPSVVTSTYYDSYGNKIKTEVGDSVETYTTDYAGNITSVKSPNANANGWSEVHTTQYDLMGNVIRETDELGNSTRAEYDWLGRMIRSYDQNNYASEYKYDNMGRVIEQKIPFEENDGTVYYSVKKMWYDDNGNVVKEQALTNASGEGESYSEVKYTYDNRNRLAMTETNDGEKSSYVQYYYDAKGNILRTYTGLSSPLTINGLDNVTVGADSEYAVEKNSYDKFGRLISTTDALGQAESHTYDQVTGLLQTTTDRKGQTFNFAYNGMGNMTSKSLSDGTNVEIITYDLTGQVLSKQNGQSTISYVYNNKGQLVSESDTATGATKAYTYDANGNRTGFTLTRNGTTEINQTDVYDKLNRLTNVSENGTVIAAYTYDNKGNRTQTSVTGGETTSYTYNLANMLTSQTSGNKLNEQFTYYLNGNQKSKTVNGETTNYVYDSMNRLTRENDTVYTFDDFGNRATMSDGTTATTYAYDLNNRLTESNAVSGDSEINTRYFYDANGNQTTKATLSTVPYDGTGAEHTISENTNEDIAIYEYNCYNQLIKADTNGVVSTYTYFPDGLRHSKTVGNETTSFVYDNGNIVEEITSGGSKYYYRGFEIIQSSDGYYYIHNGQGDVAMLTDSTGAVVANYTFDAYGNSDSENTIYNPFGYRGEYTDIETGLIYLRNRYYDPETGRFINEDPIRDGLNWYMYCNGNPIMFVDPLGLEKIVVAGGAYHEGNGDYQFEFVDAALKRLDDIGGGTLLVANAGWTKDQYNKIVQASKDAGVNLLWFSTIESLTNYINYGGVDWLRSDDPITSFDVFAHATDVDADGDSTGLYAITFGLYTNKDDQLRWYTMTGIDMVNSSAFANDVVSSFYSCRTGNTFDNGNFAQKWANTTGGTVYAYTGTSKSVGRSDYSDILGTWSERQLAKIGKGSQAFRNWQTTRGNVATKPGASYRLPKASYLTSFKEFTPN